MRERARKSNDEAREDSGIITGPQLNNSEAVRSTLHTRKPSRGDESSHAT